MTHRQWPARRIFGALGTPLLMAGLLISLGSAAASASGCQSWTGVLPPSPGASFNKLDGVTVLSPCDTWAVGFDSNGTTNQSLIEHWNGSSWTVVPSPDPGSTANVLSGVRAVSSTSIWAVGYYSDGNGDKTLILHWNGRTWTRVASPNPGGASNKLWAVAAASASNAWVVGSFSDNTQALAFHCC